MRCCRLDEVSTTIRVAEETHAQLVALSRATGASLMDTVQAAAEALQRQLFARTVAGELSALRADPEAWADYVAGAELAVGDGIGR